jgi:hypothetical protein
LELGSVVTEQGVGKWGKITRSVRYQSSMDFRFLCSLFSTFPHPFSDGRDPAACGLCFACSVYLDPPVLSVPTTPVS